MVPQEIGRVLLNLFTNAFHAVNEKKHSSDNNYSPQVQVSTRPNEDNLNIPVKNMAQVLQKALKPKYSSLSSLSSPLDKELV